jgi:hypothetical protein
VPPRAASTPTRSLDLPRARDAPELDRRDADLLQQRVRLRLVVRALHRLRRRDEHRHREALACGGKPGKVERRLRQHDVDSLALDELEHCVCERGV